MAQWKNIWQIINLWYNIFSKKTIAIKQNNKITKRNFINGKERFTIRTQSVLRRDFKRPVSTGILEQFPLASAFLKPKEIELFVKKLLCPIFLLGCVVQKNYINTLISI